MGDMSGTGLALYTKVYGKWVLNQKFVSVASRQEEQGICGCSTGMHHENMGRPGRVVRRSFTGICLSLGQKIFLSQKMLPDSRDARWLKGLHHYQNIVVYNIHALDLF